MFQHTFLDSSEEVQAGKVVCVGRNYLEHIKELGNSIPDDPIIFMKPSTSLIKLDRPIKIPEYTNECHHEIEIAVLIGEEISQSTPFSKSAIIGYGLAIDLTLRDIQNCLKEKGHPWEKAKAFDNSCPISPFILPKEFSDINNICFSLEVNDHLRQKGNSQMMMCSIIPLIEHIAKYFTLLPGDVVLTGTPKGVGPIRSGDRLKLTLQEKYTFFTTVL